MVKESKYDHHPVRIVKGLALGTEQEFGGILQLDFQTAVVGSAVNTDDTGWIHLDLGAYAPKHARAALLDIAARDGAGAANDNYLEVGNPGIIYASETQIVYCGDVNDRYQSRLVVALLNDDDKVNIRAVASGAAFDYTIKLIGWVIDPYVAKVTLPYLDMSCTLVVQQ